MADAAPAQVLGGTTLIIDALHGVGASNERNINVHPSPDDAMSRFRWLRLGPAVLLVVAGCTRSHKTAGAPATTSASTLPATAGVSPPTTTFVSVLPSTIVVPPSTRVLAAASTCSSSKLVLAEGENYSAHAENDVVFTLTNEAPVACTLSGYPGVSFLNGTGGQVGPDATRHPSPVSVVNLAPGAMAEFQEVDGHAVCPDSPRAPQMRVFPPNQTAALTIAVQLFVCHPSVTAVSAFNPNRKPLIN